MNQDIGELFGEIELDAARVGAVVALVVAVIIFGLVSVFTVRTVLRRGELARRYETLANALEQFETSQARAPERLQAELTEVQQQIGELLQGFPTTQEARERLSGYYSVAGTFDTQVVRLEAMLSGGEADGQRESQLGYTREEYLLETHGQFRDLLRFLRRITDTPYETLDFHDLSLSINDPSWAEVVLTVYSSDLAGQYAAATGSGGQSLVIRQQLPGGSAGGDAETQVQGTLRDAMREASLRGDWSTAVAYGEALLEAEGAERDVVQALCKAHTEWGRELAALGYTDRARDQYEAALSLVPGDAAALDALHNLYRADAD